MKIGYFADGPWSHAALERILEDQDFSIGFIVVRYPNPDPILVKYAEKNGIPLFCVANVNDPDFRKRIEEFGVDVNVSMSFNQIIKKDLIHLAPQGFINCHAGLLPFYRGRNILNWALINGEKEFGVTVMYVDEGIDTGDIILQGKFPITDEDDYGSVLSKAYQGCAEFLYKGLELMRDNQVKRIRQNSIHAMGFYCGRRISGDEFIDWSWTSERIHNFVRAITIPGPCARVPHKEGWLAISKTELIPDAPNYIGCEGEVVGKDAKGIVVKTGDSTITISEVCDVQEDGSVANRRLPRLAIGTRLARNPWLTIQALENRVRELEAKYNGMA